MNKSTQLKLEISAASLEDVPSILEIYNWAILETTATFDTEAKTLEQQIKWFHDHKERHPIIVAKINGLVVGWGSITQWSDRRAYDCTGEVSFYVLPEYHGKGIGKKLLNEIINLGKERQYLNLLSRIAEGSETSIYLHKKLGFRDMGTMKQAGQKFGKTLDVYFMQYIYNSTAKT